MTAPSTLSRRGALAAGGGLLASLAAAGLSPDRVRPEMRLDSTVPTGSWPGRKRDPRRTGYQPVPGPRTGASVRWRFLTPRDPTASPGVVATPEHVLAVRPSSTFALRPGDGSLAWETGHRERDLLGDGTNEFVQSGPQLAAGHVLTVADISLYGLDTATGSGDWAYGTNSSFREVLAVGNTVFFGSLIGDADRLVALSAETGLPYWRTETVARPLAYAPDDGILVTARSPAGADNGVLQGRDARSGAVEWTTARLDLPLLDASAPAVGDGRVYVASGPVYAFDTGDGSELWRAPYGTDAFRGPVTDGDRVYVTSEGGVAAFDAATGEERWTADVPVQGFATPAIAADRLYVPVDDGVTALVTADGSRAFRATFPGGRPSGLAVADGRLYVRNERGVFALEGER